MYKNFGDIPCLYCTPETFGLQKKKNWKFTFSFVFMSQCPVNDLNCAPWASCFVDEILPCSANFTGTLFLFCVYCTFVSLGSRLSYNGCQSFISVLPGLSFIFLFFS